MKKSLSIILLGCFLVLGNTTGCENKKEETTKNNKTEEKILGKCEVEECINLIEPEMKLEEVNEIIGFEGKKKEESDTYIWELSKKTKIEVEYKDNLGTIKATMDKEKIANDKIKLSTFYDIQGSIKKETYTYEQMVEKFEGIEGHLETKAPTFKMYKWVKDDKTFRATFSDNLKGKCSIVSIR